MNQVNTETGSIKRQHLLEILDDDVLHTEDLGRDYPSIVWHFKYNGAPVPSRVGETREILNFRLKLMNPKLCIISRKGFSRRFMDEEITQLLAGVYDHDRLHAISPTAASLISAQTAYGPRTYEQLEQVARELEESPTSRRAVVYIGRPDDLHRAKNDPKCLGEMPCTEKIQFHLREGQLHTSVSMRSWDIVWGLTYDVPSFVSLQFALCDHLGVTPGTYTHTAGSAHIYDRHYGIETWSETKELDISHLLRGHVVKTRENARKVVEGG